MQLLLWFLFAPGSRHIRLIRASFLLWSGSPFSSQCLERKWLIRISPALESDEVEEGWGGLATCHLPFATATLAKWAEFKYLAQRRLKMPFRRKSNAANFFWTCKSSPNRIPIEFAISSVNRAEQIADYGCVIWRSVADGWLTLSEERRRDNIPADPLRTTKLRATLLFSESIKDWWASRSLLVLGSIQESRRGFLKSTILQ